MPDEVLGAGGGRRLQYGPDYILPLPFDPRLMSTVPPAVARAAMDSGVARKPCVDLRRYARDLSARLDPIAAVLGAINERVRANPRRVVFAEGEEDKIIRAAVAFRNAGYGTPVLIGREDRVLASLHALGLGGVDGIEVHNARLSGANAKYVAHLYERLQRRGYLQRDCQRMVNQDRNIFGALMVATGDADAMITGVTRAGAVALRDVLTVIDPVPGGLLFGLSLLVTATGTVFVADTAVNELPTAEETADIAIAAARAARRFGAEPRVALLSYSTFGNPMREKSRIMRDATRILESRKPDFEFDGEMSPEVALDPALRASMYPFCRLTGPANVLVMPGLHSAHITTRMVPRLGAGQMIGPLLIGLSRPVQIVPLDASVNTIVEMACLAAHETVER